MADADFDTLFTQAQTLGLKGKDVSKYIENAMARAEQKKQLELDAQRFALERQEEKLKW